ncbi:hypothetical protein HERIO_980 [Hepatospora eriocheir]|uniref:Uncharacterized protein n=1 Tax=Hepatospora eriocheir TaxID=1081669 RepID=A0A1X0QBM6_9MICR|nr:hypothetical protein HERIO_980 [Hepatospora eriocheir]
MNNNNQQLNNLINKFNSPLKTKSLFTWHFLGNGYPPEYLTYINFLIKFLNKGLIETIFRKENA